MQTLLIREGLTRSEFQETSAPIYMTSGYVYDSAEEAAAAFTGEQERFIYSRYGNPTVQMFQSRLAALEGAEACFATASGMAAVFAALASQVSAGDRIVAPKALFGSCLQILTVILPRFGVEATLVDGTDLDDWARALETPAKVVFLESPSNPALELVDLEAVVPMARAAGARVVVDNVFATPILQKPLALGADVVIYSATKHIDGQGRALGGAVLGTTEFITEVLQPFVRHTGPSISPFNAWLMLKGLETLQLRVRAQCDNAHGLADWLEQHPKVKSVRYPGLQSHPQHGLAKRQMTGFGTLVAFQLEGGQPEAFRMMNALKLVDISNNLGDSKTLITHPPTTTHRRVSEADRLTLGITPSMVRLSVGLEGLADLRADFEQALAAV
ncbi:MAG: O-succinylhomoserine sulfhydrylase [Bradymonadia bacterium]